MRGNPSSEHGGSVGTLDAWRAFLHEATEDLVGGTVMIHDEASGDVLHGPVSKIYINDEVFVGNGALIILTDWTDRLPQGVDPASDGAWQGCERRTFVLIEALLGEPQQESYGRVSFTSELATNTLFPRNHPEASVTRRS